MYDNDDMPTADCAQKWLGLLAWLEEKRLLMVDRFIRDFSAVWNGEGDARPPQSLHDETVALQRKFNDGAVSIAIPGTSVVLQLDGGGNLIIMGGGRQHIEIPHALFDVGYNQLQKPGAIPDALQGPPASNVPLPGSSIGQMSAPPTNQQMSMRQNELALKHIKQKR